MSRLRNGHCWSFRFCVKVLCLVSVVRGKCNRKPQGASGDCSPADEVFKILINGNPPAYIPGQQYNISLTSRNDLKFLSFTLAIENENNVSSDYDMNGHFEITDKTETRFSLACENMIEGTNLNGKVKIDTSWIAPTNPESKCVLLKAAVVLHRNVWYMDDGSLTKRFCPEETDDINTQTPRINPCCACDEAKYKIFIKRNWSRNTHAKDFPFEAWRTRFSEVIGASHTFDYRFWDYGTLASQGLQELAEHGAAVALEEELTKNVNANNIRTIIKAPGILYRNNTVTSTLAHVRVDPQHHLISLVLRIDPSPDWILGVSAAELCLRNCTWVNQRVLNLYPWDIGTDGGSSYMSPDQPQVPPDVIRHITSRFPNDPRSPFYDQNGTPMKPLATLYITRKKTYERKCDSYEHESMECATHPWNEWSECSSKCGSGIQMRIRTYKDEQLAISYNCKIILSETKNCIGEQCGLSDYELERKPLIAECDLTQWSEWSPCSKRCGTGYSKRTRVYVHSYAKNRCQSGFPLELEQIRDCNGDQCGGKILDHLDHEQEEFGLLEGDIYNQNYPSSVKKYSFNIDSKNLQNNQGNFYEKHQLIEKANDNIYNKRNFGTIDIGLPSSNGPHSPIHKTSTYTFVENYPNRPTDNQFYKDDINGRKNVMISNLENNKYNSVQDYCFEKPFASLQRCSKGNIVNNYWFYEAEDHQCKIFTADLCDESKNKFRTLEKCEKTCYQPQEISEDLLLPYPVELKPR